MTIAGSIFLVASLVGGLPVGVVLIAILLTPKRKAQPLEEKAFEDDPGWSSCFFWALRKWWKHGGYLCFRPSKVWFGPHILWLPKEGDEFLHFVPDEHTHEKVGWNLHWLIIFKGRVKRGD